MHKIVVDSVFIKWYIVAYIFRCESHCLSYCNKFNIYEQKKSYFSFKVIKDMLDKSTEKINRNRAALGLFVRLSLYNNYLPSGVSRT